MCIRDRTNLFAFPSLSPGSARKRIVQKSDFSGVMPLDSRYMEIRGAGIPSLYLSLIHILTRSKTARNTASSFMIWAASHSMYPSSVSYTHLILIFIDDYFNCLTVGTVMRPVTDRFNITRAKLAYICLLYTSGTFPASFPSSQGNRLHDCLQPELQESCQSYQRLS